MYYVTVGRKGMNTEPSTRPLFREQRAKTRNIPCSAAISLLSRVGRT